MAKLHKKVVAVLKEKLSNLEDALEDLPGGRVSGVVVSPSFNSMDHRLRQKKLGEILKKGLDPAELSLVGAIAALTPAEAHLEQD